jgi:hypothetical protein
LSHRGHYINFWHSTALRLYRYAGRMENDPTKHHHKLLRDVIILQAKLFVEALRDVALSPVTLAAALLDFALSHQQTPRYFYRVLRWGRQSDEWIDPWSASEHGQGKRQEGLDALLSSVEQAVNDPAHGARRARVLKRWAERHVSRARRRIESSHTPGPPPPPA